MSTIPQALPFAGAIAGPFVQLSSFAYVWYEFTSAKNCLSSPLQCLSHPFSADPWGRTVVFTVMFTIIMWLVSLRTLFTTGISDPSIVDRLWSIMPWLYTGHWCLSEYTPRLLLMTALTMLWGFRLTYNFWIKGGFSGGVDHRWAVVQKWYPGWRFEVFNLVFICLFQQFAILAFVLPAVPAMQSSEPLGMIDAIATILYLMLVAGETIADQQMFDYQTEKYRRQAAGEGLGLYARGFIETGLWAYSRHPNYFCEVTMWWVFYLFSIAATGQWINWTLLGAIYLACLFLCPNASLDLTEAISLSKYSAYPEYQSRVSKFVPWPPRQSTSKAE